MDHGIMDHSAHCSPLTAPLTPRFCPDPAVTQLSARGRTQPFVTELDPDLAPDVLTLAESVRAFFRTSFPEVEERVYAGARSAGYRTSDAGTFCGLFIREPLVHLVFTRGADLPDTAGLLRGAGAGARYVTYRPGSRVDEESLFPLVVAALLVGGGAEDGLQPPLP